MSGHSDPGMCASPCGLCTPVYTPPTVLQSHMLAQDPTGVHARDVLLHKEFKKDT
jgi:hypothetical protein